ncbi:MAG: tetratricopeptide repeat protein [Fimbriimonas ginsengisoli]|uniref:Tetratricopeptide repeat protein n=1 Tax=Fimbriimonas ginsengisoli TaxID=1005039 RepID=A0A931LS44_FIMGI|nr:tetratricopeptide repeat protein [Fimbriimonas ginsengisoli]
MKRGAFLRLLTVCLAAVLGAIIGWQFARMSIRWQHETDIFGFFGGLIGLVLVYLVSGAGLLISKTKLQQRRHRVNTQLRSLMRGIENACQETLEETEADTEHDHRQKRAETFEVLAIAHLMTGETEGASHEFELARELGAKDASLLNNSGVAQAKLGRLPQAMSLVEQACAAVPGAKEPYANLAHIYCKGTFGAGGRSLQHGIDAVHKAIALDPEDPGNLERLGQILTRVGRTDEAMSSARSLAENSNGARTRQADAHNLMGVALLGKREHRTALHEFQSAARIDPTNGAALANIGATMIAQEQVRESLEPLLKAVILDPNCAAAQNNLGIALATVGAVNEAVHAFREASRLDPSLDEPHYNLGKVYADHGVTDLAARHLVRATQINPYAPEALLALGVVEAHLGHHDKAIEYVELAARYAPNDALTYISLGTCRALAGEYELAEQDLSRARDLDKDNQHVYGQLAYVHMMLHDVSTASSDLTIALSFGDMPLLNNNYALTQLELKGYDAALLHFNRSLSLKPDFHEVHYNLGYLWALKRRVLDAVREWEIAERFEAGHADCYVNLGVAYYLIDRLEECVLRFRRVLTMRTDRIEDYSNLAMAYSKQGVVSKKLSRKKGDRHNQVAVERFSLAIGMFDLAIRIDQYNVVLHSNRGLACFFANRFEEAFEEWSKIAKIDPEYAKKRGELTKDTVFDESCVNFVSMKVWERAHGLPPKTHGFKFVTAPSYAAEEWNLMVPREDLAGVQQLERESREVERAIRALVI